MNCQCLILLFFVCSIGYCQKEDKLDVKGSTKLDIATIEYYWQEWKVVDNSFYFKKNYLLNNAK